MDCPQELGSECPSGGLNRLLLGAGYDVIRSLAWLSLDCYLEKTFHQLSSCEEIDFLTTIGSYKTLI